MEKFSGRVLVVEDDHAIAQLFHIHLSELGLSVDVASDAESAALFLQKQSYAICLLDWMLPGVQGIDLLKELRKSKNNIKVLMITAKADSSSIVSALDSGADDYLTKPFDYRVLIARVRNLLRRTEFEKQLLTDSGLSPKKKELESMTLQGLSIHFLKHTVFVNEENIHFTLSEFKLISALLKSQGQVLTRNELIHLIQGDDVNVTGRTIDTHVFSLRKKLGVWADHIETIRGVGYRIIISTNDYTDSGTDSDEVD